jgi:hypothetical protein
MRRVYHDSHVLLRFLMTLTAAWTVTSVARADCRHANSGCLNADGLWLDPFHQSSVGTSAPHVGEPWRLTASASFLRKPLVVHAASPDPFGNEIAILDNWWTTQLVASRNLEHWDIGLVLPVSYGTGRGAEAISTRASSSGVSGVGDPHIVARIATQFDGVWLSVTQRVALPLGSESSFLTSRSLTYAPKLTLRWERSVLSLTTEVGARLRSASEFGNLRFGSEAYAALNAGWKLPWGTTVFVEWWATPNLTVDEATSIRPRRVRRSPSEALLGVSQAWDHLAALVGLGTSVPLSTEEIDGQSTEGFAGPPGPRFRLHLQLATDF